MLIFIRNLSFFILYILSLNFSQRSLKVFFGHFYARIYLAHSFMYRFWWKFRWMLLLLRRSFFIEENMTFDKSLKITKGQLFYLKIYFILKYKCYKWSRYAFKGHFYVLEMFVFTFRPSDPITILTYVLMNNSCPCLKKVPHWRNYVILLLYHLILSLKQLKICKLYIIMHILN